MYSIKQSKEHGVVDGEPIFEPFHTYYIYYFLLSVHDSFLPFSC